MEARVEKDPAKYKAGMTVRQLVAVPYISPPLGIHTLSAPMDGGNFDTEGKWIIRSSDIRAGRVEILSDPAEAATPRTWEDVKVGQRWGLRGTLDMIDVVRLIPIPNSDLFRARAVATGEEATYYAEFDGKPWEARWTYVGETPGATDPVVHAVKESLAHLTPKAPSQASPEGARQVDSVMAASMEPYNAAFAAAEATRHEQIKRDFYRTWEPSSNGWGGMACGMRGKR